MPTPPPSIHAKTTPGPAPNGQGRGLFASTDIQPGESVLGIQSPFVAVLDTQRLDDTCSGCFGKKQLETGNQSLLKACTGCQVVKYCDRACQAQDWKTAHSLECPIFQKLSPRILPINARAVLRMVLRSGRKKYPADELDLFLQLETHIQEIRDQNPAQWERIMLSSKAVKTYSGTGMKEETISAFSAKLDVNSFNLTNALYDRIGLYLHPYAALINHSCEYNSVVGFDGHDLFITAIRPIRTNDQISISYVDTTNPRVRRQSELRERYFFTCHCPKCQSDTDNTEAALPEPTSPGVQALERNAYAVLDATGTGTGVHTQSQAVDPSVLESAMQQLQSASWPITRQPLVSLRDELIAAFLAAGRFRSAFLHAAIRYLRVDPMVYSYEGHPLRHLHAWTLAKIAIHLSQGVEGEGVGGEEIIGLERFELNYGLIIWSVLSGLVAREGEGASCTVPGFRKMLREAFGEVHREFLGGGLDPRGMAEEIKREWGRVGEVVKVMLEGGV